LFNNMMITTTGNAKYILYTNDSRAAYATYLTCHLAGSDHKKTKAFIGNVTLTNYVSTPSATKPVIHSAWVASNGTVTNDHGTFLSSCTNASPMVCTINTGIFSQPPSCSVLDNSLANNVYCGTAAVITATSISIICRTDAGSDVTTSYGKTLICHGVQ